MKLKKGERVRIKFEYNYNSLNWGYIADFDVEELQNRLFLYSTDLKFFIDERPMGMEIHQWEKVERKGYRICVNCTSNKAWCEDDSTIVDILLWDKENNENFNTM